MLSCTSDFNRPIACFAIALRLSIAYLERLSAEILRTSLTSFVQATTREGLVKKGRENVRETELHACEKT